MCKQGTAAGLLLVLQLHAHLLSGAQTAVCHLVARVCNRQTVADFSLLPHVRYRRLLLNLVCCPAGMTLSLASAVDRYRLHRIDAMLSGIEYIVHATGQPLHEVEVGC